MKSLETAPGWELVTNEAGEKTPQLRDQSWERAKALWADATRGADAIIELGILLHHLRDEFFQPLGGDRRSSSATGRWSGEKGWQATVREQLGISHQTAIRLMDRGWAVMRLKGLADGEDVEYLTKGETKIIEATPETIALAQEALPEVVSGAVSATRAWAGVCGEGARRAGGTHRAAVDHLAVMLRALRSLRLAAAAWDELAPMDRAAVEEEWEHTRAALPKTWRAGR